MTEVHVVSGLVAGLLGALLGAGFYGSLWWTVRRALSSRRPGRWFVGSLALRSGLALGGIFLIGGNDWWRMLACLLGFLLARPLVARLTRTAAALERPVEA